MYSRTFVASVGWATLACFVLGFVTGTKFLLILGVMVMFAWTGMSIRETIDNHASHKRWDDAVEFNRRQMQLDAQDRS